MEILPQYEDNLISTGLTDSVSMTISSDVSHLFTLMSKNLYGNPKLAAVREIITNAWDAHIDAGCSDKPIHIKSDGNTFTIQDFGKGLSKSEFLRLYGTVGESSKRSDNRLTGGMGIGKMAPLAALPYFSVRSHHEGIATTYHISGPTEESMGVPTITEIVSVPTDITGLEVIFPAPLNQFSNEITSVVNFGAIKAAYIKENGEEEYIKTIPDADIVVVKGASYFGNVIKLRYGNIVYPIHYSILRELNSDLAFTLSASDLDLPLVVLVEPGKAVVTPNREELVFSDSFKDYLRDRFKDVYQKLIKSMRRFILENPLIRIEYASLSKGRACLNIGSYEKDLSTYCNSFALEDLYKHAPFRIGYGVYGTIDIAPYKDAVICRFNRDILKAFRGIHKSSVRKKIDGKFKKLIHKSGIKPKNVYTHYGAYVPDTFGFEYYQNHQLNTLALHKKIVIHYRNPVPVQARKEDTLYIRALLKTDVDTLKRRLECFLGSEVDIEVWEDTKAEKPKQEKKVKNTKSKKYVSLNKLVEYGYRSTPYHLNIMDKEVEKPEVIISEKDWKLSTYFKFAHWLTSEEITKDKVVFVSSREYSSMMRRKNPPKEFQAYIKEKIEDFLQDPDVLAILQLVPYSTMYLNSYLDSDFRKLVADVLGVKTDFDDSLVNRAITVIDYGAYVVSWNTIKNLLNKDENFINKLTKLKSLVEDFDVGKLKEFDLYEMFVTKLKERIND